MGAIEMRTPSMTPLEAEREIGIERGKMTFIGATIRPTVKKWLSAMGIPSAYVARMRFKDMIACYNDLSNSVVTAHKLQAKFSAADCGGAGLGPEDNTAKPVTVAPMTVSAPLAYTPVAKPAVVRPLGTPRQVHLTGEESWDGLLRELSSACVVPNTLNRVLLYGPPRTGKSTTASNIFAPVERVTLHKQQPVDDLLGGYCLKDGTTVWSDGPAVRALRYGRPLVLDEVDQMSGECRFTLHALMDDPAAITLASGERVEAAPGYTVIGTTNASPQSLPLPVLDRFDLVLYCGTISDGLRKRLGKLGDPAQRSVASMAMWTRPSSPNLLLSAAKLKDAGLKPDDIARILYPAQPINQADLVTLLAMA